MNTARRKAFLTAITQARAFLETGSHGPAMLELERAHVLGQVYVGPHVLVHWLMLRVAVQRGLPGVALGQLVRIVLGAIGSAVGVVPTGNRGSSDVSMFRKEAIPPELARLMEDGPD